MALISLRQQAWSCKGDSLLIEELVSVNNIDLLKSPFFSCLVHKSVFKSRVNCWKIRGCLPHLAVIAIVMLGLYGVLV